MILAVLGQLGHESSTDILERFVWLTDREVFGDRWGDDLERLDPAEACHFRPDGALQARAAEMLVWVTRGGDISGAARILASHPAVAVRVATIDALSYGAADEAEALGRVTGLVLPGDRWAIGLPRRTADGDPETFDARVFAHLETIGSSAEPRLPDSDDRGEHDVR